MVRPSGERKLTIVSFLMNIRGLAWKTRSDARAQNRQAPLWPISETTSCQSESMLAGPVDFRTLLNNRSYLCVLGL